MRLIPRFLKKVLLPRSWLARVAIGLPVAIGLEYGVNLLMLHFWPTPLSPSAVFFVDISMGSGIYWRYISPGMWPKRYAPEELRAELLKLSATVIRMAIEKKGHSEVVTRQDLEQCMTQYIDKNWPFPEDEPGEFVKAH